MSDPGYTTVPKLSEMATVNKFLKLCSYMLVFNSISKLSVWQSLFTNKNFTHYTSLISNHVAVQLKDIGGLTSLKFGP